MTQTTPLDRAKAIIKECIETCTGEMNRRWYIEGANFHARLKDALEELENV